MLLGDVEAHSLKFLTKLGAALDGKKVQDIVNSVKALMNDADLYKRVIENQNRYINKNASQDICECVIDFVNKC